MKTWSEHSRAGLVIVSAKSKPITSDRFPCLKKFILKHLTLRLQIQCHNVVKSNKWFHASLELWLKFTKPTDFIVKNIFSFIYFITCFSTNFKFLLIYFYNKRSFILIASQYFFFSNCRCFHITIFFRMNN
jgi:hypothetical protein